MKHPVAVAAGVVAAVTLAASGAKAVVFTYDFTGTLSSSAFGSTSVTGDFTLNQTTDQLVSYSFNTPIGLIDSGDSSGFLAIYAPAINPAADFFQLEIISGSQVISLVFESDVGPFSGGPLYVGSVQTDPTTHIGSGLSCFASPCLVLTSVSFASGTATLAGTPEPAAWALMLAGFAGLGAALRSRRRFAAAA